MCPGLGLAFQGAESRQLALSRLTRCPVGNGTVLLFYVPFKAVRLVSLTLRPRAVQVRTSQQG